MPDVSEGKDLFVKFSSWNEMIIKYAPSPVFEFLCLFEFLLALIRYSVFTKAFLINIALHHILLFGSRFDIYIAMNIVSVCLSHSVL